MCRRIMLVYKIKDRSVRRQADFVSRCHRKFFGEFFKFHCSFPNARVTRMCMWMSQESHESMNSRAREWDGTPSVLNLPGTEHLLHVSTLLVSARSSRHNVSGTSRRVHHTHTRTYTLYVYGKSSRGTGDSIDFASLSRVVKSIRSVRPKIGRWNNHKTINLLKW